MKWLGPVAASVALVGLTACSTSGAPHAAPASHRTPVSCHQQYRTWTHGAGKTVMGALHGVSSATKAGDDQALSVALRHAKPAVAVAARHPIPACADPRGYWAVVLMHVSAAASARGPAASARAALVDVPRIHHQLLAEVRHTVS
jgi:hypothetical protein